jgi:hypothetical protein
MQFQKQVRTCQFVNFNMYEDNATSVLTRHQIHPHPDVPATLS